MGDYRDTRKRRYGVASGDGGGGTLTKKVTISVKKESRGIPYILITQNMWRELGMGNGIYRVELSNDEKHEFYVYYHGEGKIKLAQKDLKPEKQYTLTLTKIDLPKVIDEINNRIRRKYGNIQFRLMDNKDLYMVLPSGRKLKINEYELEKPFGGELRLLIKLKRNPYSNVILQILLSNNDIDIKLISSIQKKKGKVTRPVSKIYEIGDFLAIEYWKAPKKATSYIPTKDKLDPDKAFEGKNVIDKIIQLRMGTREIKVYSITINKSFSEYILALYRYAAQDRMAGYNFIKEKIGLVISESLLRKWGFQKFIRYPLRKFRKKGPDLMVNGIDRTVYEIKITRSSLIDLKYDTAIREIYDHVYRKYSYYLKKMGIRKFGVIVIALSERLNIPINAIVYYNVWRVEYD